MTKLLRHARLLALLVSVPLATALALAAGGCGSELIDEHPHAGRIEIETRGTPPTLLAVWNEFDGWHAPPNPDDPDAELEPLDELPTPVHREGEGLLPLRAGGDHTSLSVRFFERDGTEIAMSTLSRDDDTGERECSAQSARFFPSDDDTELIAWPPIRHPDSPDGSFQFAELASGDITGIFHCDHVHIYPEIEGTVDVEFVLWHVDHADDISDPITLRIEAAE
jgi:hypothetical protein